MQQVTYRAVDGREYTGRAVKVRAKYAASVWQGIGGEVRMVHLPAGVELWALAGQRWAGVPTDPRAMFTVVYRGGAHAAQPTSWTEVPS